MTHEPRSCRPRNGDDDHDRDRDAHPGRRVTGFQPFGASRVMATPASIAGLSLWTPTAMPTVPGKWGRGHTPSQGPRFSRDTVARQQQFRIGCSASPRGNESCVILTVPAEKTIVNQGAEAQHFR